jgi:hypothetical protein
MKNIYRILILIFLISITTFNISLNAIEISDSKYKKAKELMKTQGMFKALEDQKQSTITTFNRHFSFIINQISSGLTNENAESDSERLKKIQLLANSYIATFIATFDTNQFLDIWIDLYCKNLTESDIDAILKYYKSPIGQKDVKAQNYALPIWSKFISGTLEKESQNVLKSFFIELEKTHNIKLDKFN